MTTPQTTRELAERKPPLYSDLHYQALSMQGLPVTAALVRSIKNALVILFWNTRAQKPASSSRSITKERTTRDIITKRARKKKRGRQQSSNCSPSIQKKGKRSDMVKLFSEGRGRRSDILIAPAPKSKQRNRNYEPLPFPRVLSVLPTKLSQNRDFSLED